MKQAMAEERFGGDGYSGSKDDSAKIKGHAMQVGLSQRKAGELIKRACQAAGGLLTKCRTCRANFLELETRERIDGDEVRAIIERGS